MIVCCSTLETVGTMGETLRVKAGEDAIKRVQQGFDKVAKEKQMSGYVIIIIIFVSVECGLDCLVGGLRKADQARRTVSQHRLHTAQGRCPQKYVRKI